MRIIYISKKLIRLIDRQPNAALVCGLAGGDGAMSPPARVCAREVMEEVVMMMKVVVVVGPCHTHLAFMQGQGWWCVASRWPFERTGCGAVGG